MDFLFEIGLEEVPARMIAGAEAELLRRTVGLLVRERLVAEGVQAESFSTPRRLAVRVPGVAVRQENVSEQVMGPAAKIAYKDGVAGPAAVAFAKKSGVRVEELSLVATAKGEYVAATVTKAGRSAAEVLAAELPKEIAGIYWAKNMHWRAGKPERFVRPVRWLVAMLGAEVVPVCFGGYEAGAVTFGHRVLYGDAAVRVTPESYLAELMKASVMCDVEARRHTIRKALDRVCRTVPGARWREDHGLVDKMTHMTEWPSVIEGAFEPEYLELPEEVLVTVMRDHQNYFAVEDRDGRLMPHFLAVLNTVADARGEAVIRHGNERVLRARFNDARFFWEFDQRVALEERVVLLEKVTFQKDLGSYAEKSLRVAELARGLAWTARERGVQLDEAALEDAARLMKADLTCELVKEFTELQGVIGGLYARAQGVAPVAANAIYDQYLPAGMEDGIPRSNEGIVLGIADRADTIAGMFGLGLEPTGSKDPFALRRAANGIVKMLAEGSVTLSLADIVQATGADAGVQIRLLAFFAERVEFYLREAREQAYDVVKAVLAVDAADVRDAVARAEAVTAVRGGEDVGAVSAAYKRMKNILAQAAEKGFTVQEVMPGGGALAMPEQRLMTAAQAMTAAVHELTAAKDYAQALTRIAALRPEVDVYFDQVMILDPDAAVRGVRLGLLRYIARSISGIADLSEIVVAG